MTICLIHPASLSRTGVRPTRSPSPAGTLAHGGLPHKLLRLLVGADSIKLPDPPRRRRSRHI